ILVDQLEWYLAAFYPQMPLAAREAIIQKFMKRPLEGRLPEVAGIMTNTHARHQCTSYEVLLRKGPRDADGRATKEVRNRARKAVADELNGVIKRWCKGAPVSHRALAAIRRRYRKRYRAARSMSAPNADVALIVASENAELAEFCRRWIWGH